MYNDRPIPHGSRYDSIDAVAFTRNTHATRVREKTQEKIQGLCVAKKAREVALAIDDEVGWTLYVACTWSEEEHDRVFSKTARAITMKLFEKEEYTITMYNRETSTISSRYTDKIH